MEDERRARLKAKLLRGLVLAMTALGVLAAGLCFAPAVDVYEDARDCLGHGLRLALAMTHGARTTCEPAWNLVGTRGPVAHPLATAAYFTAVIAPGLLVWRWPKLRFALVWTALTVISTLLLAPATFAVFHKVSQRTVDRSPAHVFAAAAFLLITTLIVLVPLACLGFALATRKRSPPKPEFPTARVVR